MKHQNITEFLLIPDIFLLMFGCIFNDKYLHKLTVRTYIRIFSIFYIFYETLLVRFLDKKIFLQRGEG